MVNVDDGHQTIEEAHFEHPALRKAKQEGQDEPGLLNLIFEITFANFFFLSLSEKNLQEFLYVRTMQVAPIH